MISLGMIVRDEGRTIAQCLESALPFVDEVVIGLAGESKDNTFEEIERVFDQFPQLEKQTVQLEWTNDFAAARNAVLQLCQGDYFLWLDGDDVLVGGEKLRSYVERFPNINAFYMGYDYARDEFGNNTCFLVRERLVRRDAGFVWKGAVHEVLVPQQELMGLNVPDIYVVHHKPADKHSPSRNLDILYTQLEESEPNPDPRILAYLGSENAGRGNLTEALLHWQRFVKLSGWDEEKYQTQVKISNTYRQLGRIDKALQAAYHAIEIKPDWPDAYISLARSYCSEPLSRYDIGLEWLKVATEKPVPETMLIINPQEYSYEISVLISICYTQLGDFEMALKNYEQAYRYKQEPLIAEQIAALRDNQKQVEALNAFTTLREYLARHDEWLKVRKLFDVVPHELVKHPLITEIRERTYQQTAHIDQPKIMEDFYRSNPHWGAMDDETILKPSWLQYPRLAYALSVAKKIHAGSILDWGCSDGFISLPLAKETKAEVTGFDLDPRCVDLANDRAKKWGLSANFLVGNVDDFDWDGRSPADLAILFEVIEHVNDPAATLAKIEQTADHIALTTPFLAWDRGNLPAWDKLEPKGHLRIFDLEDMEMLLQPRGRIFNLYRQPYGNSGWIFADYSHVKPRPAGQRIVIGAQLGTEKWGPQKLQQSGLGGSETAVIKLAEALVTDGDHDVTVYCPIDEPGYYNSVRYRDSSRFIPEVACDTYIAWRMPEAADWDVNAKRLLLWMHDTDAGDRLTPERAAKFDQIMVLTEWHRENLLKKYSFLDPQRLVIVGNGVDRVRFAEKVDRNPKKVVYASSPDRGLDIILEHIWPRVVEQVPDAELHIYYGWDSFDGAANFPGYQFLRLFKEKIKELLINSRGVIQHGRINQDELAKEFQSAAIWLYPTYFSETYCITAVEAQLGGAIPVTNHLAALKETVKSGVIIEGDVFESNTQLKYADAVISLLKNPNSEMHRHVIDNAPALSWSEIARKFVATGESNG